MNHPAELALHQYLDDAVKGKTAMSKTTIQQVATDVAEAMQRQFGGEKKRKDFRLRMSNVGRPTCQLWYDKNKPEKALPFPTTFIMNMMLGDIVEAVFKGLMTEAGIQYEDSKEVSLDVGDSKVSGTYDIVVNDAVDDIKSASDWSYRNKFESYDKLAESDGFGYIGQLAGYAKASGKRAGGWWVVNKANGQFKYVPASGLDMDKEVKKISNTVDVVKANKFKRCFEAEDETFRGKSTGNKILNTNCKFCSYRFDCWSNLVERPAVKSQAKQPRMVAYVELNEEYGYK